MSEPLKWPMIEILVDMYEISAHAQSILGFNRGSKPFRRIGASGKLERLVKVITVLEYCHYEVHEKSVSESSAITGEDFQQYAESFNTTDMAFLRIHRMNCDTGSPCHGEKFEHPIKACDIESCRETILDLKRTMESWYLNIATKSSLLTTESTSYYGNQDSTTTSTIVAGSARNAVTSNSLVHYAGFNIKKLLVRLAGPDPRDNHTSDRKLQKVEGEALAYKKMDVYLREIEVHVSSLERYLEQLFSQTTGISFEVPVKLRSPSGSFNWKRLRNEKLTGMIFMELYDRLEDKRQRIVDLNERLINSWACRVSEQLHYLDASVVELLGLVYGIIELLQIEANLGTPSGIEHTSKSDSFYADADSDSRSLATTTAETAESEIIFTPQTSQAPSYHSLSTDSLLQGMSVQIALSKLSDLLTELGLSLEISRHCPAITKTQGRLGGLKSSISRFQSSLESQRKFLNLSELALTYLLAKSRPSVQASNLSSFELPPRSTTSTGTENTDSIPSFSYSNIHATGNSTQINGSE